MHYYLVALIITYHRRSSIYRTTVAVDSVDIFDVFEQLFNDHGSSRAAGEHERCFPAQVHQENLLPMRVNRLKLKFLSHYMNCTCISLLRELGLAFASTSIVIEARHRCSLPVVDSQRAISGE